MDLSKNKYSSQWRKDNSSWSWGLPNGWTGGWEGISLYLKKGDQFKLVPTYGGTKWAKMWDEGKKAPGGLIKDDMIYITEEFLKTVR